jgi:protein TonB
MPRISTLFSIAIHVIVVGGVIVWSTLSPDLLPSPRSLLAYHDVSMIKIAEVPPPRDTRPPAAGERVVSPSAAPLTAPDRIIPETGMESVTARSSVASDVPIAPGVPGGLPGGSEVVPPPPPTPPPPATPIRLHSGMQAPQKIVDVTPVYPELARAARRGGLVILEAVISAKGHVESVRVLRGVPLLEQAAVDAVRQWRFTPALLNGQPVPVVMTVTVNFNLQ